MLTTKNCILTATCDMCGRTYTDAKIRAPSEIFWCGTGQTSVYSQDTKGRYSEYHICPDCFKLKLEPWLKRQLTR